MTNPKDIFTGVGGLDYGSCNSIFGNEPVEPILIWAGNKRKLLKHINQYFPSSFDFDGTFYDLFTGSGAVALGLGFEKCVMNDLNADVILVYQMIRNHCQEVMDELKQLKVKEDVFLKIRDEFNDRKHSLPDVRRAAYMIYLTRTCYSSGYRLNAQGEFNQAFGDRKQSVLSVGCLLTDIKYYLLRTGRELRCLDFELCLSDVKCGDIVYADPPYDESKDGYNAQSFGYEGLSRLSRVCDRLTQKGVCVVVSNYYTPLVRKLFPTDRYDFQVLEVNQGQRAKGSNAKNEVVIWNRIKV